MAVYYKINEDEYHRLKSASQSLFAFASALDEKYDADFYEESTASLLHLLHDQMDIAIKSIVIATC